MTTYEKLCSDCEFLYKHIEQLEAYNERLKQEINLLEKRCDNLESDVEDAYRQLDYYED